MGRRLAAIVVTHNRLDKLGVTVSRLLDSAPGTLAHLVVVDNASTDGTGDWLNTLTDPRLLVLSLNENTGGAGGFAAGMAHVRDRIDPDWTVLMDDDARPRPGALDAFHEKDRSAADAWAAAVTYPGGAICEMNRPWVNPFWHVGAFLRAARRGRAGFHLSSGAYASPDPTPIDGGSFVGLFLSRDTLHKTPLPDPRLFVYGDDVLYTLTLSGQGGSVVFDPSLGWEHDCASFDPNQRMQPLWKVYYYHRNLILAYRLAAGPVFFWPAYLVARRGWRARADAYGEDAPAYRRILDKAIRDGLAGDLSLAHARVMAL